MATILVVDDRPLNREFLVSLLGYYGHVLLTAADGAEALAITAQARPDLVITDILMPTMDGIEFIQRLRRDPHIAETPVIFYTATYRLSEAREMGQRCGVRSVLAKPAEPEQILAAVNDALGAPSAAPPSRPAVEPPPPMPASHRMSGYLGELIERQQPLQHALEQRQVFIGEQGNQHRLSNDLAASLTQVHSLGLRLSALIELGMELGSERDVAQLLNVFIGGARDIMNAKVAAVVLLNAKGHIQWVATRGLAEAVRAGLSAQGQATGLLADVITTGRMQSIVGNACDAATLGLPLAHPAVSALLAVPIKSTARTYGWLYFADKLRTQRFAQEDEQIADTLAGQLALAYESLMLVLDMKINTALLEREIDERKRAEERARENERHAVESEQRFRQLAENIREVFFLADPATGEQLYISPAYEEIWGRSVQSTYENPELWSSTVLPEDRERLAELLQKRATDGLFDNEFRILRPDDSIRWIRARGFPIRDEAGRLYRIAGLAEDITVRKEQEDKIARLNRIHAVLSGINSTIVRVHDRQALLDEACRIAVNAGQFGMAWIGMIDAEAQEVKPAAAYGALMNGLARMTVSIRPDVPEGLGTASEAMRTGQPTICNDMRSAPHVGVMRGLALTAGFRSVVALPLRLDTSIIGLLVLYATEVDYFDDEEMHLLNELSGDISFALQYITREERLHYLSYYDALTGLPNRTLFLDRLGQFLHSARHDHELVAVILLDIDHFKQLNDTLGRHIGDELLKMVGERLGHTLAEPYSLARVGADRFAVAIAALPVGVDAAHILQKRISAPLAQHFATPAGDIQLTLSAGVALFPDDGEDAESLLAHAESALKQGKQAGDRCTYYAPEINARIAEKLELARAMQVAIEQQQFVMYYQPRVSLLDGRIVGAEALIRWQHPEWGLVPPVKFIPLAEETGLIVPLGDWTLAAVCAQLQRWLLAWPDFPPVAVNLSAVQFRKGEVAKSVRAALDSCNLAPAHLELELTESVVMQDPSQAITLLESFSQMGITLALDDFGTGYSSLAYLKRFPFDVVKIDRAFVTDITQSVEDAAIATAIVAMAHALNLRVVAEGVETVEQLQYLRRLGCDEIQGYLFSKPVPAAEYEALVRDDRRLALPD